MDETFAEIVSNLRAALPGAAIESKVAFGELTLTVPLQDLLPLLRVLKSDAMLGFVSLIDICGVDYPNRAKRFDVVYHLLSPTLNVRLRLKVETDEDTPVPTASALYPVADWFEREVYDLYGVFFSGHPDLRRILTDYGFDGHPLRKDFPLSGYVEVHYDDLQKRVVYDRVHLPQEYRDFDFLSPWEGTDYVLPGDEKAKR